jgi:hypothetical protein
MQIIPPLSPRFGRQMTEAELERIRPLVRQVPVLGDAVADRLTTATCSVMDSPGKLGLILKMPLLIIEALRDKRHADKAVAAARQAGDREPILSLQWVRFPEAKSDTLELSNPCKGDSCPLTREGKPARGRATQGRDMISWFIHEAPDEQTADKNL